MESRTSTGCAPSIGVRVATLPVVLAGRGTQSTGVPVPSSRSEDRLHVWYWDLDGDPPPDAACLSAQERARAGRFRLERERRRWTAAHARVRQALGEHLNRDPAELSFVHGTAGKPALADAPALHFNLSHSSGRALFAVSAAGPVGVDVEGPQRIPAALDYARHSFDRREAATLARQPPASRSSAFLAHWVAKEAMLKADGAGLSKGLEGFALTLGPASVSVTLVRPDALRPPAVLHVLRPEPGFVGAIGAATDAPIQLESRVTATNASRA